MATVGSRPVGVIRPLKLSGRSRLDTVTQIRRLNGSCRRKLPLVRLSGLPAAGHRTHRKSRA